MLIQKQLLEKLIELASDSAEYLNEKWITVHPHGSDSKGTHVKVEDGESNKEAVERKFDSKIKEKKGDKPKYKVKFKNIGNYSVDKDMGMVIQKDLNKDKNSKDFGTKDEKGMIKHIETMFKTDAYSNPLDKEYELDKKTGFRKYRNGNTNLYLKDEYAKLVDNYEFTTKKDSWSSPILAKDKDGNVKAIIMPIQKRD